ncbi:unnamed protein product, partial [Owenia fusiformis]
QQVRTNFSHIGCQSQLLKICLDKMPPKPSGKGGKKKLTKAEKEKLKKEEAERKAAEEEEARQAAAAEEDARKEKEKAEATEIRRLENEERRRRKAQLQELYNIIDNNKNILLSRAEDRRKNAKWARYMRCDGSPDPTIPGEINAYMNLWRDRETGNDIHSVLSDGKLSLSLIDELKFLLKDTPADELTEQQRERYTKTIQDLDKLLQMKMDRSSHELLLQATELSNSETSNLQSTIGNEIATLCMWGNLSKNPRIKSHEFEEMGFTFELPKILTLSDCAMRILFLNYDHFSMYCKTFYPRKKEKIVEEPVEEEVVEEVKEEEVKEEAPAEDEPDLNRENTEDLMASLYQDPNKEEEEPKEEEVKEEVEELEEEFEEIKTPEPVEWEDFDGDEDMVDLRAWSPIGPIFQFNLLQMPPQPKVIKNWTITQNVEPELVPMPYLCDTVNPEILAAKAREEEEGERDNKKDEGKEKREERPPIAVNLILPKKIYFCEEPQVARWDAEEKCWRLDGFTDISFSEENRTFSFKTAYFGTMTLLQDLHINMPFQSWELRPHGTNHAVLSIIAAIIEVEIDIKEDQCCLIKPDDRPELDWLVGKWMAPQQLKQKMIASGMNIFPNEDSSKYVRIQNKNPITMHRIYEQVALTASAMAYSWSKWNAQIDDFHKVIIQGAEMLEDEPLLEEDWSMFMITSKRTMKLKMTEFDDNFSEEVAENTNFHADLYHMAQEIASEEAKQRITNTSYEFTDCVQQLMFATKLLSYS